MLPRGLTTTLTFLLVIKTQPSLFPVVSLTIKQRLGEPQFQKFEHDWERTPCWYLATKTPGPLSSLHSHLQNLGSPSRGSLPGEPPCGGEGSPSLNLSR